MRASILIALIFAAATAALDAQCVSAPPFMTFWAPLDDAAGAQIQNAAKWPHKGVDVGAPAVPTGLVVKSRTYDGVSQYTEFPDDPSVNVIKSPLLQVADFTIDCWINVPAGADLTGVHTIVDKRAYVGPGVKGYALYLYDGWLGFQMGDGGYSNWIAFTQSHRIIPGSGWHFVAVSVDRAHTNGGALYVDLASWGFDPTQHQGSLVNAAPLRIGARTVNGSPDAFFPGGIDEVEIHQAAFTAPTFAAIYNAGAAGKCKVRGGTEGCANKVLGFSDNQACMNYCFTVYNANATARTLSYGFVPLPPWNGSNSTPFGCNLNGPSQYIPASGIVTVPPYGYANVCTVINRPAGTGNAAFKIVMTDTQTSQVFEGLAVVSVSNSPLNTTDCGPFQGPIVAGLNRVSTGSFRVTNTGPAAIAANFQMSVQGPSCTQDLDAVSLNQLPPGTPWTAWRTIGPGQTLTIPFSATFRRHDANRAYAINLSTDAGGVLSPINGVELVESWDDTLTLSPGTPEAGAIDLRIDGARPFTPVYSFFNVQAGAFPYGWLFGLDLALADFEVEYAIALQGGAPFLLNADSQGKASWSLAGLPPGIPFFGISAAIDPLAGVVHSSPVAFVTW